MFENWHALRTPTSVFFLFFFSVHIALLPVGAVHESTSLISSLFILWSGLAVVWSRLTLYPCSFLCFRSENKHVGAGDKTACLLFVSILVLRFSMTMHTRWFYNTLYPEKAEARNVLTGLPLTDTWAPLRGCSGIRFRTALPADVEREERHMI